MQRHPEYTRQRYGTVVEEAIARVGAVRETVGPDVDLCVEIHRRMSPMEAIGLSQELVEFRANQAENDHRTEDGLETVRDTLGRLVDRLAIVETGVRAGVRTSAEPQETRVPSGSRTPC